MTNRSFLISDGVGRRDMPLEIPSQITGIGGPVVNDRFQYCPGEGAIHSTMWPSDPVQRRVILLTCAFVGRPAVKKKNSRGDLENVRYLQLYGVISSARRSLREPRTESVSDRTQHSRKHLACVLNLIEHDWTGFIGMVDLWKQPVTCVAHVTPSATWPLNIDSPVHVHWWILSSLSSIVHTFSLNINKK